VYPLKTLYVLIVAAMLSSCHKVLEYAETTGKEIDLTPQAPVKNLLLDEFKSMLTKDKWYVVGEHYTADTILAIPSVNEDDRYNFDLQLSDGSIDSKQPCIEYHYIINAYLGDNNILFDWLNFSIAPKTYTVDDYKVGEWFVLKADNTYTKYVIVPNN
jgi:hypothetical protein